MKNYSKTYKMCIPNIHIFALILFSKKKKKQEEKKERGKKKGERACFRKSEFLHIVLRILKKLCVCQRLIVGDKKEKRVFKNEVKNNF